MKSVLSKFDEYLAQKNLRFTAVIIGGAALNVMDVTSRVTKDVDCIDPSIPEVIKKASVEFAKEFEELNLNPENWLNNGPISILRDLEKGWRRKTVEIYSGKSLTLYTLDRINLLKTKLYAYCDRDIDFDDCLNIRPTLEELNECYEWVLKGDGSELWPDQVDQQFLTLKKALGYE